MFGVGPKSVSEDTGCGEMIMRRLKSSQTKVCEAAEFARTRACSFVQGVAYLAEEPATG